MALFFLINFGGMKYNRPIILILFLCFCWSCKKNHQNSSNTTVEENKKPYVESIINPVYTENIKKFPPIFLSNQEIQKLDSNSAAFHFKETFALYNQFMETGDETAKKDFLNNAAGLKSKVKNKGDFSLFSSGKSETISVIDQSFTIAILSQAFALTNDNSYLEMVKSLTEAFNHPVTKGGFRKSYSDVPFYTDNSEKSKMILSNHLYALSALYYAGKTTGDENAILYFGDGVETLKISLKDFDIDFTSLYGLELSEDNQYAFASAMGEDPDFHHELVIKQLIRLYLEANEPVFKEYAHLFLKQDMGSFSFLSADSKFSGVKASHSVDSKTLGVNYLDDELWSWGKYWSTNQLPTDLIIEFRDEKKNIEALTFVSIKKDTSPKDFKIYVKQEEKWVLVSNSTTIRKVDKNYYFTGNYESFIDTYYLTEKVNGSAIKIEFLNSYSSNLITVREINVMYDRSAELNQLIVQTKAELGELFLN